MKTLLGPGSNIHVTKDLEELDRLMSQWTDCEETLCFYGGDGSIARGLTSLIRHRGESEELPPFLAVRAGTINMLCSVAGVRENCNRTFQKWRTGQFTQLKEIPTLRVEVEGEQPQYGFVFAWGVGYRVLRDYYDRSPSPDVFDGFASFTKAFLTAMHPKGHEKPLFKTESLELRIDGREAEAGPLRALTIGTISRVTLGMRPFSPVPIENGRFHVTGHGISLARVVAHTPTLCFGLGDIRKLNLGRKLVVGENVRELECRLTEGFTMDGEVFELKKPTKVRISAGPVVRFWAL